MGFSVLWDASNTQPDAAGGNGLTPEGKRPVSKATEKRRQRLAEEQEQQRQEEEKRMLQQRRQQTVREIRQRQAAAAEAAGRATPSSAVQSEAANESAKRAAPGQRQDNAGQRAAHGLQPVQARAGLRAGHHDVSQSSQARVASPSAHASRKVAPRARDAVDTQSSQKQGSTHPRSAASSVRQQSAAAGRGLRTLRHSAGHHNRPMSRTELQEVGQRQQ